MVVLVPLLSQHFRDQRGSRGWLEGAGRSTHELSGLRKTILEALELERAVT